jgi:DDE superfamily endonuclease
MIKETVLKCQIFWMSEKYMEHFENECRSNADMDINPWFRNRNKVKRFILVIDNASFHASKKKVQILKEQSDWLTAIFLPKRSPNLNPVEISRTITQSKILDQIGPTKNRKLDMSTTF